MSHPDGDSAERTLPMTVANTGFMLDRLGRDCGDLQFLRELTQNSIEAIQALDEPVGEIVWDVDWDQHDLSGGYKLCITDTGIGMAGPEMVRYINQLSSSVHEQSHEGNFGVGAKIAAATRNHEGLVYLSWQSGVGSMIHLWRDPQSDEYGLRQIEVGRGTYDHWAPMEDAVKPDRISENGTKVVLLGHAPDQNTMTPPSGTAAPSVWIARYLNTRYFSIPEGVTIRAREGWEFPREDTDNNVLRTVVGQESYLQDHAENSGRVDLTAAVAHWWILRDEKALSSSSGYIASSGHTAALYQNELYEMEQGRGGVARLQNFGVIFGYKRVVIYVEPSVDQPGVEVSANTARTDLRMNSSPLPWADWGLEFRKNMPGDITRLMADVAATASRSDHAKSIRERLQGISDLFKLSRYRPNPQASTLIGAERTAGGRRSTATDSKSSTDAGNSGGEGGGAGNVYGLFTSSEGTPADRVAGLPQPKVLWLSAHGRPGCQPRDAGFLEDRAAKYLPDQNLLQVNADFRVFTDMVDRWLKRYRSAPGAETVIEDVVREWFEQALLETVLGLHGLRGSKEWTVEELGSGFSEEALSAAVMQRYHVDVAVKRSLGSKLGALKKRAS